MKSIERQFKEATNSIVLSEAEKGAMRERLIEYMGYKPIRVREVVPTVRALPMFSFFKAHHVSGALLIAFLATTSSFGVSYAAGDALPGDLLYPVKVNINEEIKTALLSTDESKLAWEQERAERRLDEASKLASEGRLDTEKKEQVAKLFAEHTGAVVEQVLRVEERDPILAAEASSMFEETLDTHEAVLARLIVEREDDGVKEDARDLVEQVRAVAIEVEKIREDAEEKLEVTLDTKDSDDLTTEEVGKEGGTTTAEEAAPQKKPESANMRIRAAERVQARAQALEKDAELVFAPLDPASDLKAQAGIQMEYGKSLMREGAVALEDFDYSTAYGSYRKAAGSFQKVKQMLEAATLYSIEIYPDATTSSESDMNDADVDTEVSDVVKPSTDEVRANEVRLSAEKVIQDAQATLLTKEGYDIAEGEKANKKIKDAGAYVLRGEIAMVLQEFTEARALFTRAHELAQHVLDTLGDGASVELPKDTQQEYISPVVDTVVPAVSLTHTFANGVHTYSGTYQLPTPCHEVFPSAMVAESFPEQIRIDLSVPEPESDTVCAQVLTEKTFVLEVVASEGARISSVSVNGRNVTWENTTVASSSTVSTTTEHY